MNAVKGPAIHRLSDLDEAGLDRLCARGVIDLARYIERARPIVERVRRDGDAALVACAREFDGVELAPDRIRVPLQDFEAAETSLAPAVRDAIRHAARNIRNVHERQRPAPLAMHEIEPGVFGGEHYLPIAAVACYVPRGKGSFPSVALMTAIPAVAAGCPRVVIVTPPGPGGRADAATLVAAREAGVGEVYLVGGAQAVAAVAYGTATVPKCLKVVGPGSPWVAAAMQLCAGVIEPGLPAGPSESLILADAAADPERCALDLLVEAEHGADSTCFLVTPSETLAFAVARRVAELWDRLPADRRGYVQAALGQNGGIAIARDLDAAIAFANRFAPEHLQIATANPRALLPRIDNAGEVLLGQETPFSLANFVIGVTAVLPTGGHARAASALGTLDFMKRISVAEVTGGGRAALADHAVALALYEGFPAHAMAVTDRAKPT
ncbi:MAG: histidinol dehydrogenase [Alphaproteobacteria bacterium]|nr:histidinol dehydrogenase [Alphaproteobacteria bacterium]